MTIKTIAGPFLARIEAEDTAKAIGANCSVFSVEMKDSEGYGTGEHAFYVEQNNTLPSEKIFGYDQVEFMAKQYK